MLPSKIPQGIRAFCASISQPLTSRRDRQKHPCRILKHFLVALSRSCPHKGCFRQARSRLHDLSDRFYAGQPKVLHTSLLDYRRQVWLRRKQLAGPRTNSFSMSYLNALLDYF